MRQVNIKELNKHLSAELSNLPFAVTKNKKVIAYVVAESVLKGTDIEIKSNKKADNGVHLKETVKEQLTKIIKKKQGTDISEATIDTGETPVLGYPKSYQARKKKK